MRSHVTIISYMEYHCIYLFQYRKRYEVTCDSNRLSFVTLNRFVSIPQAVWGHMWLIRNHSIYIFAMEFQYRKRYEVTCDFRFDVNVEVPPTGFNTASGMRSHVTGRIKVQIPSITGEVSIPQAVWGHMWLICNGTISWFEFSGFNTASGMRSHVTDIPSPQPEDSRSFQYRKRYEVTCDWLC